MGWYADTTWNLTFASDEALEACAGELRAVFEDDERFENPDAREVVRLALLAFNEEGEIGFDDKDALSISGSGWMKAYDIGPSQDKGGIGVYAILAKYATGTVDWDASSDGMWRVRFANSDWEVYGGEITYPGDPGSAA